MTSGIEIAAITFDFIGKVLVSIAVILVHYKIRKEKGIDKAVLKELTIERDLGFTGIVFLILGYALHLIFIIK